MKPQRSHVGFTRCSWDGFAVVFVGGDGLLRGLTFLGSEGVDFGDSLVFAEADARLELEDDWESGCGAGTETKNRACQMETLWVSVFPSAVDVESGCDAFVVLDILSRRS